MTPAEVFAEVLAEAVDAAIERFDDVYGGDVTEYLEEGWEQRFRAAFDLPDVAERLAARMEQVGWVWDEDGHGDPAEWFPVEFTSSRVPESPTDAPVFRLIPRESETPE